MSIKGSAYARFRRALETDSPSLATAAAYELPQLNLADALRLCLVYARADRPRFDRAIVRWHARLCLDAKGLDPATAHTALAACAVPGESNPGLSLATASSRASIRGGFAAQRGRRTRPG